MSRLSKILSEIAEHKRREVGLYGELASLFSGEGSEEPTPDPDSPVPDYSFSLDGLVHVGHPDSPTLRITKAQGLAIPAGSWESVGCKFRFRFERPLSGGSHHLAQLWIGSYRENLLFNILVKQDGRLIVVRHGVGRRANEKLKNEFDALRIVPDRFYDIVVRRVQHHLGFQLFDAEREDDKFILWDADPMPEPNVKEGDATLFLSGFSMDHMDRGELPSLGREIHDLTVEARR